MRNRKEIYTEAAKFSNDGSTQNIRLCLEVLLDIRDLLMKWDETTELEEETQ